MLVPLEAFAEIVLLHQPALHQHLERPVDRRLADPLPAIAQLPLDLLYRKVLRRREHHFGDRLPLLCDRQPLLSQVAAEEMDKRHDSLPRGDLSTMIIDSVAPPGRQAEPAHTEPVPW